MRGEEVIRGTQTIGDRHVTEQWQTRSAVGIRSQTFTWEPLQLPENSMKPDKLCHRFRMCPSQVLA